MNSLNRRNVRMQYPRFIRQIIVGVCRMCWVGVFWGGCCDVRREVGGVGLSLSPP